MHISDFDYDLPPELVAREPAQPRDAARMMVLDSRTGGYQDSHFQGLAGFLDPSDILVLNNTRVIRARIYGRLERRSGSTRQIEVFFAEPIEDKIWGVLCRPGRRIRPGDRVVFGEGAVIGVFRESQEAGLHVLELISPTPVLDILHDYGELPLPQYIDRARRPQDDIDYQTVFAAAPGAVAAPTAGLHFTEGILESIRQRGVEIVYVTLHVGIGTFLPVRTVRPEEHVLRPERFEISAETADRLRNAQHQGRRVVAVGTTTTRTLEFVMRQYGEVHAGAGYTDLYILPGFEFKLVGALLTNFHLPRSTLLMLVCAFAGRNAVLSAYRHAIDRKYRFYSYGDCMLIT